MGIIDDYYGGYQNLALYTDEDGNVDFDAAYGTTFPFATDSGSDDSAESDCGGSGANADQPDAALLEAMRAFCTKTDLTVKNELYEESATRTVKTDMDDIIEWEVDEACQIADVILKQEGYSSWTEYCHNDKMQQRRHAAHQQQLSGQPEGNLLWWLWHTWRPHVFDMAAFLLKLAEKDFSLALKLQRSMVSAHTSAEAQLSSQGLLYTQLCEANKQPINNVSLKKIVSFMRSLTAELSISSNRSSHLPDDSPAANSKDGQAAQLLAGMLTGALTHKTYRGRNARERDLVHLVELIQSHVCKGKLGRALQVLGWMQYVHVSDPPHEWLKQMIFDESDHDLFGYAAGGYGVGRLLHHMAHKGGWNIAATANACMKIHSATSVFSDRNNKVDDCHLILSFESEVRLEASPLPDETMLQHIRTGELYRGITESWECKKAAELLHAVIPASPDWHYWAYPLSCIATFAWQSNHVMDGWTRACNIFAEFCQLFQMSSQGTRDALQWIWDGLPGHDGYENWVLSEWQVPSDALKQQYLLPKLKAVQ